MISSTESLFATPSIKTQRRRDGSIVLRSLLTARTSAASIGDWLRHWADKAPGRTFIAERASSGGRWRRLSYAETHQRVQAIAGWILDRGLCADKPLAILSDNSVDHALMALGAIYVGVPVATISSAYSLISSDHQRLLSMVRLLEPGAIYVSDTQAFGPALKAIEAAHAATVVTSIASSRAEAAILIDELLGHNDQGGVADAAEAVAPHTIARFLFTSGSTGSPKAVINTHGMLTSNQDAKAAVWPFLEREAPILVDWLPWSHTFGANHNFNMVLRNGGTLYIDSGRPAPHLIGITAGNLKDVTANLCFNVPRGYDMLVQVMREDAELRQKFFSNVRLVFYAAAALPQNLWEAIERLSGETVGRPVPMVSAWGLTETAPLATDCHFQAERSGNIGVPVPGIEVKLVPNDDKLEIRVRGPNVTPGYWKQPELTKAAFDEEGFYITGDAVRLADPKRPERGLYFDGRVVEDFKLSTGTMVHVGQLRIEGIAALDPIAQDIVVTGHDTDSVAFLIYPNMAACRRLAGLGDEAPIRDVLDHPKVRAHVGQGLAVLKDRGGGSSRYATRARLLETPPSVDRGEITDKGYINQRAALSHRAEDVALLRGDDPTAYVACP